MHEHYGFHELVAKLSPEMMKELLKWRARFIESELTELYESKTPEDAVDALIDIIVVAVGTLDLFGVDGPDAWREVQSANMKKALGIKPGRPNPFGFPDLMKPEGWVGPDHAGNYGRMGEAF